MVRHDWGYEITGSRIERLVERTDFDAEPAVQRFQVILDRMGVSAALADAGAEPGDTVPRGRSRVRVRAVTAPRLECRFPAKVAELQRPIAGMRPPSKDEVAGRDGVREGAP